MSKIDPLYWIHFSNTSIAFIFMEEVRLSLVQLFWKTLKWHTAQKIKFSIKDFFSKCDKIRSFLHIWVHLLKKSLMENFTFLCSDKFEVTSNLFLIRCWKKGFRNDGDYNDNGNSNINGWLFSKCYTSANSFYQQNRCRNRHIKIKKP